jgi:hypothetical protein
MSKEDLSTLKTLYRQFTADTAKLEKLQKEMDKILQAYSKQQKMVVASISGAEKYFDDHLAIGQNKLASSSAATRQINEMQQLFNLQYLQLQSQMQHENRSYTAISNIMKTKHDTVKNSISNVR